MSTALAVRRAFSVAKAQGTANEDDHRYSNPRGVYAVSDGASISYDSASWSRILVEWFKKKPAATEDRQIRLEAIPSPSQKMRDETIIQALDELSNMHQTITKKKLVRTFVANEMDEAYFVAQALKKDGRTNVTIWRRNGVDKAFTYSVTWNEMIDTRGV